MVSALKPSPPGCRLGAWPHAPPRLPRGGATHSHPGCAASGAVFGLDPSEHGGPFDPQLGTLFGTPMRRLVFKAAEIGTPLNKTRHPTGTMICAPPKAVMTSTSAPSGA